MRGPFGKNRKIEEIQGRKGSILVEKSFDFCAG